MPIHLSFTIMCVSKRYVLYQMLNFILKVTFILILNAQKMDKELKLLNSLFKLMITEICFLKTPVSIFRQTAKLLV